MTAGELIDLLSMFPADQEIIKRDKRENLLGIIEEKDYLSKEDFFNIRAIGREPEVKNFLAIIYESKTK